MIPHSQPTLTSKDAKSLLRPSIQLAQAEKVSEFEKKVSRFCGTKSGVAVNSGTSALHLSLLALGIGPGDEVILPSYVCSAPLNAVHYTGARPRIVDVDEGHFNISAAEVKKRLNKKTKAVIVPHLFGCPADLKGILRLGVPVIEDCAQAIGACFQGQRVGSFGVLSVFSFYATKVITTGEGGMVLSDNARLLEKIRDLRQYDNVPSYKVRFNYKMTEIQAALGLSQLAQLPAFLARRKQIAQAYSRALRNSPFTLPQIQKGRDPIYFRYVIKVTKDQKRLMERLKKKGIKAEPPVFKPLHQYFNQHNCPVSDKLMKQCISIPIYPNLTDGQVRYICKSIQSRS